MSENLPEQVYRGSTALAGLPDDDPYALDQSMVTLPMLLIAQFQSQVFKKKRAEYGAIVVAFGADDPKPITVGAAREDQPSEAVVFYVHRLQPLYDYIEDPANPKDKTLGRPGVGYAQTLAMVDGDPRRVWQSFGYTVTAPAFAQLPLRMFARGMAARSARWMNSQIGIMRQEGTHPLTQAFQVTARPTTTKAGQDYALMEFSLADVKAAEREAHQELVQQHADLLASGNVQDAPDAYEETPVAEATEAPPLD